MTKQKFYNSEDQFEWGTSETKKVTFYYEEPHHYVCLEFFLLFTTRYNFIYGIFTTM